MVGSFVRKLLDYVGQHLSCHQANLEKTPEWEEISDKLSKTLNLSRICSFLALNKATHAVVTDSYVDRPQSLSSHAFCGSQSSASQKRRCIMGPTLVRSPLIPLLRPERQLERLDRRGEDTHNTLIAVREARIDPVQTGWSTYFTQNHSPELDLL
ncbi:Dynein heavy chain 1 axonemal [Dissostichus eleginoides]|uniref:Dynein heavy chain 1 axonemal n=1 Tax=Dissostichus eleginoides TaxID=100907 RepID=A0AAD9FLV2_DISEL|nr:Dynein heavy chain 1 axonemal [Dissostichus eleginoides]